MSLAPFLIRKTPNLLFFRKRYYLNMSSYTDNSSTFPVNQLLPKAETLATEFLSKNPTYDGRNTIVAIFDTGVDPGAKGLQTTTTGLPKVIDLVDATGSGDVLMYEKNLNEDGKTINGLSGRSLTLNSSWDTNADSTKYYVGLKPASELFPSQLLKRVIKKRRESFDESHRAAVSAAENALAQHREKFKGDKLSATELATRSDLVAKLDALSAWSNAKESDVLTSDPGPIYDVIAFKDSTTGAWQGAVDVTETGDFSNTASMGDYGVSHNYGKFTGEAQMNFALKFYLDNDESLSTLCIVCDAGAHGTHVAGIVAAHHPKEPQNNGIAPGAQIIGVKIGDSRLGSMETGSGLIRGLIEAIRLKADVINMSYGEYACLHNSGRFVELVEELVVRKAGITFVCSAGNEGPGISSAGAPGGTSSALLGVGAYVSPDMMATEYTMRESVPGIAYTWSSRGPTFDGDLGVNICAPGGAIASVPNWTLKKSQLMNGTSMSSPNAAGNIALLISGLKANAVHYNPFSIRRALENTAKHVRGVEPFAQGRGLIQVLPAFDFLTKHAAIDGSKSCVSEFVVTVPSRGNARGIYLREFHETNGGVTDREYSVLIDPFFHDDAPQEAKIALELRVALESKVPWLEIASDFVLMHGGRSFSFLINFEALQEGTIYYTEICGYDSECRLRGPIFRVPVSVIKPRTVVVPKYDFSLSLLPGKISRDFIVVPAGASFVNVTIRRTDSFDPASSRLFLLHLVQLLPQTSQSKSAMKKAFRLERSSDCSSHSMSVVPGTTLEVCVAQFWSSLGNSTVTVDVEFRGVLPDCNSAAIQVVGGEGATRVTLTASLQNETVLPVAKLNRWQQRLRPKSSVIKPLSFTRDMLPEGRQIFGLMLAYEFSITEDKTASVTPRLPLLNDLLYESPFGSQLVMIFDSSNKRYIGASDAFASSINLVKGSYVAKVQVRHDDPEKLKPLKNMVMMLEQSIKYVDMVVYSKVTGPSDTSSSGMKARLLRSGTKKSVYIAEPSIDAVGKLKGVKAGDLLVGNVTFRKKNGQEAGSSVKPDGGYVLKYSVPPLVEKEKEPVVEEVKDTRTEAELTEEAIQELRTNRVQKLEGKDGFMAAYDSASKNSQPNNIPLRQTLLRHNDMEENRLKNLQEIVKAADAVLECVDLNSLAMFFGTKVDKEDSSAAKLLKEKEKEKSAIIDALCRKARALGDLKQDDNNELFESAFKELKKWVDVSEVKYFHVGLLYDSLHEHWGLALARVNKVLKAEKEEILKISTLEKLYAKRMELHQKLGWSHLTAVDQTIKATLTPADFVLF